MSVFWTVISGTLVFVIGQLVLKLLLEPVHGVKSAIGEAAYTLILTAHIYANPGVLADDDTRAARHTLRAIASKLAAARALVPLYVHTRRAFGLPSVEEIDSAVENIIRLSNSLLNGHGVTNAQVAQRIKDELGIYTAPRDRVDNETR